EPGSWHTYTLCSLNHVAPGAGPAGLGLVTEAVGLQVFGIRTAYAVTQWRSPKLAIHARFGPLELITAWTPAHSDPTTLTFTITVDSERIERALLLDRIDLPEDGELRWIDCDELDQLRELQAQLETGRRFQIVGAPMITGSYTRVPIRELPAGHPGGTGATAEATDDRGAVS
ncbi:MAG: hypothetical protein AAGC55_08425, partial [Myxococcota bacterium]